MGKICPKKAKTASLPQSEVERVVYSLQRQISITITNTRGDDKSAEKKRMM